MQRESHGAAHLGRALLVRHSSRPSFALCTVMAQRPIRLLVALFGGFFFKNLSSNAFFSKVVRSLTFFDIRTIPSLHETVDRITHRFVIFYFLPDIYMANVFLGVIFCRMWDVPDDAWNPRCVTLEHHQLLRQAFTLNQGALATTCVACCIGGAHKCKILVEMFRSGVFFSVLFTNVARQVFKIEPKAACGLSLGEIRYISNTPYQVLD